MMPGRLKITLAAGCVLLTAARWGLGQSPALDPQAAAQQAAQDLPTPANVTEALNRALADLRIAEAGGLDAAQAYARIPTWLTYVFKIDPVNLRGRFYHARYRILGGKGSEAIGDIQNWVNSQQGETDWEGHYILGSLYLEAGYKQLALPMLLKARDLNLREPRVFIQLAKCYAQSLRRAEALEAAKEAERLYGDNAGWQVYLLLSQVYLLNEDLGEAERYAVMAADMTREDMDRVGRKMAMVEAYDQALANFQGVLETQLRVRPDVLQNYVRYARLLQGRAELTMLRAANNALSVLKQGLAVAGDRPPEVMLVEMVALLDRTGDTSGAVDMVQKLRELYPGSAAGEALYRRLVPPPASSPEQNP